MRHIEAHLEHDDDGRFEVSRLTDENGNDVTYLVDPGTVFRAVEELEALLAAEFRSPVTIEEA